MHMHSIAYLPTILPQHNIIQADCRPCTILSRLQCSIHGMALFNTGTLNLIKKYKKYTEKLPVATSKSLLSLISTRNWKQDMPQVLNQKKKICPKCRYSAFWPSIKQSRVFISCFSPNSPKVSHRIRSNPLLASLTPSKGGKNRPNTLKRGYR